MCSPSPYHCMPQPLPCICCKCSGKQPMKIKGKFGLAWVIETPDCKREPAGWQVEFVDTPARVFQKCQDMINWVNTPPVKCTCSLNESEEEEEEEDEPSEETEKPEPSGNFCISCGRCCSCAPPASPPPSCGCCCSCKKNNDKKKKKKKKSRDSNSEEVPVKDQSKVDRASSSIEVKSGSNGDTDSDGGSKKSAEKRSREESVPQDRSASKGQKTPEKGKEPQQKGKPKAANEPQEGSTPQRRSLSRKRGEPHAKPLKTSVSQETNLPPSKPEEVMPLSKAKSQETVASESTIASQDGMAQPDTTYPQEKASEDDDFTPVGGSTEIETIEQGEAESAPEIRRGVGARRRGGRRFSN